MLKILFLVSASMLFNTNTFATEIVKPKKEINWDNYFIAHTWLSKTAGVIYFEKDLTQNPTKMCEDLKKESWRLTMIDQESRKIFRLKNAIPPSYEDYKDDINGFTKAAEQSAKKLKSYCLKVNLAPVVDLGSRGYGNNKKITIIYSNAFAKAMREQKIIPTWKHFPGMNKTNETVYEHPIFKKWYKNIYGEGVIEDTNLETIKNNIEIFKNDNHDVLMFSIALYKNIIEKPIILSEEIWKLAYKAQPNSLYIPDDLSELNLTDKDIIWLYKHIDLLLYTSPNDIQKTKIILDKAYKTGLISIEDIQQKFKKQNDWRKHNKFEVLNNLYVD